MQRIQIFLDDCVGLSNEIGARSIDGQLQSFADNEWVWNEKGRLLQVAADLLNEIWMEGLSRGDG